MCLFVNNNLKKSVGFIDLSIKVSKSVLNLLDSIQTAYIKLNVLHWFKGSQLGAFFHTV